MFHLVAKKFAVFFTVKFPVMVRIRELAANLKMIEAGQNWPLQRL